jgi:molybdopterin-containing oxidoreductase family membrane subunit
MIEKALKGSPLYWTWITILALLSSLALLMFLYQYDEGLHVTAMSRDMPWGFYIAQLTFLVGVAASAVMVVLPYYLHDHEAFGPIVVLGEFLAIPACLIAMLFVGVDMGQPARLLNLLFHPSPNSPMFWDFIALFGYMCLNVVIAFKSLSCTRQSLPPPRWLRTLAIISIPWAVSIHTVTAFLYSGLSARPFWMTAVLAPRFLASAFAAGPALLIILVLILRRVTPFDPGPKPLKSLATIVTYALIANIFLLLMELFTALYSGIDEHIEHFRVLYTSEATLVPFMWASAAMALIALPLLLLPRTRTSTPLLATACALTFVSIWIEKGAGMMLGGLMPSTTHHFTDYVPSLVEIVMGIGLYALGALILTVLYKVAISVKITHPGDASTPPRVHTPPTP